MRLTCSFIVILLAGNLSAQVSFNNYFTNKSLRIDYYLSGDASQTVVSLAQLKKEPYWAGNYENLVDPINYGKYKILVYDKESNKLIYTKGFCTLFQEWQTTAEAISEESGTDIPGEMIYKKTALNSSYYTFDVARYLTTTDIKSVYDYAANVPYDQVYVLINSERYGGGGIYNHYSASTSDHELTPKVLVHEFGHGFAGLADEYYSSAVAYEDFYPTDIEPWEPNITTLVDFDSKWKDMINKKTPVPTPPDVEYAKTVGVFEGGGYMAKGVYRPYIDCRMNTNEASGFCPVCQRAISRMIEYYTKKSKE